MDWINELLGNNAVVAFLWTIGLTVFSRMIIKIFRFGVTWRQSLTTKEEFDDYRKETETRMRVTFRDVEKRVTDTCMRDVKTALKDVTDIKNIAADVKSDRKVIEEKMKQWDDQAITIKKLVDNVQVLERRVMQLQNNETPVNNVRRTDK